MQGGSGGGGGLERGFWSGDGTTTSTSGTLSSLSSRRPNKSSSSSGGGGVKGKLALDYSELFDSRWKLMRAAEKPRRRRRGLLAQTIHEESSESDSL